MPRFVVLLRGVNVGKGNRVPMAELRGVLEGLGGTGVRTLLNSGNAVFDSSGRSAARHAEAIAGALHERLGLTVPTVVKGAAELRSIVDGNPIVIGEEEHPRLLVVFAQEPAALRELRALMPLVQLPERLVIGLHAAYLYCPAGILDSRIGKAMLGKAGQGVTTRNLATVLKLVQLLDGVV